jgi:hypothetical protein
MVRGKGQSRRSHRIARVKELNRPNRLSHPSHLSHTNLTARVREWNPPSLPSQARLLL